MDEQLGTASLPPIPCAGECGRMLTSRFVRDYCAACAGRLSASGVSIFFPRPPLRTAELVAHDVADRPTVVRPGSVTEVRDHG
jgi:hypothetical protein